MQINDRLTFPSDSIKFPEAKKSLWAKTEIIGGYGDFESHPTGKSTIGEICFEQHNIVPISGVSYVFQQLFGVNDSDLIFDTLYSKSGIGAADDSQAISISKGEYFETPDGSKAIIYRYGHLVQLFGIGITGTAENDISIYDCDYLEDSINIDRVNTDGLSVNGVMLPFRYTGAALNSSESKKYFGKKMDNDDVMGFYLKRFETDPEIHHIWKTGDDMPETKLTQSDMLSNTSGLNDVESFIECKLKITKDDVKEYFRDKLGMPSRCRFNTIALFSGRYVKDASRDSVHGDYEDVRLFSKLCINPEYLDLNKDLNIIYRIYGS